MLTYQIIKAPGCVLLTVFSVGHFTREGVVISRIDKLLVPERYCLQVAFQTIRERTSLSCYTRWKWAYFILNIPTHFGCFLQYTNGQKVQTPPFLTSLLAVISSSPNFPRHHARLLVGAIYYFLSLIFRFKVEISLTGIEKRLYHYFTQRKEKRAVRAGLTESYKKGL